MGFINENNLLLLCRVCLEEKEDLTSLDEIVEVEPNVFLTVYDILLRVTSDPFIPNKNLPYNICYKCQTLLKTSYSFHNLYQKSSQILKDRLKEFVKEEEIIVEFYQEEDKSNDPVDEVISSAEEDFKDENIEKFKPSTELSGIFHPCPVCRKKFKASDLKKHISKHKVLKKYLNIPAAQKIKPSTKIYATPINNISIFNCVDIKHKCLHCDMYVYTGDYHLHLLEHKMQKSFKCSNCERTFSTKRFLKLHYSLSHSTKYPFLCNECGKGFFVENNYKCHLLIHTNDELPFKCNFCLKKFSNPIHFKRHLYVHSENRIYQHKLISKLRCCLCLQIFPDNSSLVQHICNPDENYGQRKTKTLCYVCGLYIYNFRSHMKTHNPKSLKCVECGKMFSNSNNLKRHKLTHSGVKPYMCRLCGKAFNSKYNLQVHERIHMGNKCHVCHICNKGFLEKSYLQKHVKIHENNRKKRLT